MSSKYEELVDKAGEPSRAERVQEACDKVSEQYGDLLRRLEDAFPTDMGIAPLKEAVEHPPHYGGAENPYEVIKVAEAWGFDKDAYLFNVLKYLARAGKKGGPERFVEDMEKLIWYAQRKIARLKQ